MAGRGGVARPNGPAAGNKICQFKLVLLGESAVGKSSLVLRFVKGQFHEYQESTIGGEPSSLLYRCCMPLSGLGPVWFFCGFFPLGILGVRRSHEPVMEDPGECSGICASQTPLN